MLSETMEGNPNFNDDPKTKVQLRQAFYDPKVQLRQAFYRGVARRCLRRAWEELAKLKKERGRLKKIKELLKRNDVHHWFGLGSANWTLLIMAMTALDAQWMHLGELPDKRARKSAGWTEVLISHRRFILQQKFDRKEINEVTLQTMEKLFSNSDWLMRRVAIRRVEDDGERIKMIQFEVNRLQLNLPFTATELDKIDKAWGSSWLQALKYYRESIASDELWNERRVQV